MPFFNVCQNTITWHPKIQYSINLYCILPSTKKKVLGNQDINLNVAYSNEVGLQTRTIRSVLTKVYSLCKPTTTAKSYCILNAYTNFTTRVHYHFSSSTNYEQRKLPPRKGSLLQCHILAFCELSVKKALQNQICEY
jgi:hypothetical protein